MHILTRKKGEGIVIDDGIIVSVVEIRDDTARLSIECPQEELVHKGEDLAAIHQPMEVEPPRCS
jgi:carbon storage regulator